ncbi:MAG: SPOR domain-containing protein [Azoarcus sp.]|nr:SPOR domain-containing protein [Azoarcus sp.]
MTPAVAKTDAESVENGQNLFLQLGLFTLRDNAEALRSRVLERVADLDGQLELEVGEGYFRLFVGPYASLGAARAAAERLGESLNIQPFAVWRKKP